LRARYYNPYIYRMLTPDSIIPSFKNPQNLNLYTYSLNNPVRYRDPTGHIVECGVARDGCSDGISFLERFKILKENGSIDDPLRSETIEIPVTVSGELFAKIVIPPVNVAQTSIGPSPRRGIGRVLAAGGVAIDVVEVALAVSPGAGLLPGYGDALITYVSGAFTGDNYGPLWAAQPPAELGLPSNMISLNQDAIWNGCEALIPPIAATALGISSASLVAVTIATPFPGDEELAAAGLLPANLVAYQLIDMLTSGASAYYDFGRLTGDLHNNLTLGHAPGSAYELHVIYWPHD